MNFTAIDVETANADMASICQIGLVKCENSILTEEWKTYVDPEDYFDDVNVSIHGIGETTVRGAPTFPQMVEFMRSYVGGGVVVCHTHFDRLAIRRAAERYNVDAPGSIWLDSAEVARRAWKQCARKGYGLYNVCKMLGYEFRHHDALEDAKAVAYIVLTAADASNLDMDGWLRRTREPVEQSGRLTSLGRKGNSEGGLYGEVVSFTGALEMPRREAADLASAAGCAVTPGVTKKTTILVVGNQDVRRLAGEEKSAKHRKAEELIAKGVSIRILGETDFEELIRMASEDR